MRKEIEFDAVADKGEIHHLCSSRNMLNMQAFTQEMPLFQFPPSAFVMLETARRIKRISRQIAKALNISGPFNIQYLAKDNHIMVIECNLRGFSFISICIESSEDQFIELATKIMLDRKWKNPIKVLSIWIMWESSFAIFFFADYKKADPVLGVDMPPTGDSGMSWR